MKVSLIVLFIYLLLVEVKVEDQDHVFCAVTCKPQKCKKKKQSLQECDECDSGWRQESNHCILANDSLKEIANSTDMGGNLSFTYQNGTNLTQSQCGDYNRYYGNINYDGVLTLTSNSAISSSHFAVRLIFWVILLDNWDGDASINVTFNGQTKKKTKKNRDDKQKICGDNGNYQDYLKADLEFDHNDTSSSPLQFNIQANDENNQQWGVRQFMLFYLRCNQNCDSCYGITKDKCTVCSSDLQTKLSGTTCDYDCADGYGEIESQALRCVECDKNCTQCKNQASNCSACINSAYLYNGSQCVLQCPDSTYKQNSNKTCVICHLNCTSCKNSFDQCYLCQANYILAPFNHKCYNPCPTGTYQQLDTNSSKTCQSCNELCQQCTNFTQCQSCHLNGTNQAYLLNGSQCVRSCPNQQFEEDYNGNGPNICIPCNQMCDTCAIHPDNCSICKTGFYLYEFSCDSQCHVDGYFEDDLTGKCLLCNDYCVGLTLTVQFSNSLNEQIWFDLEFTQDLNLTTFGMCQFKDISFDSNLITKEMFHINCMEMSSKSYRVTVQPINYIFLYNVTITLTTISQPNPNLKAINGRPFKSNVFQRSMSIIWFLIKAPDLAPQQKQLINGLSSISDTISYITTLPYVQQIKKAGVFNFLFSGAQITSCSVLVNSIPSQNMYEGARFWAMFVLFDVPNWQKNSDKSKRAVVPHISEVIKDSRLLHDSSKRMLFNTNSIEWRFQRTGFSTFFIFDFYPQLFMICLSWLLLAIGHFVLQSRRKYRKHMGKFYSFLHKVHQISIMYITLASIMEWMYFESTSVHRWVSLILCIIVNLYFLAYQLYVYYQMMGYPAAHIGTPRYELYAIRYGCFLKNLRFQHYEMNDPWSPKFWVRPYNYHILSFIKKILMVVSLPLFYDTLNAQISVLITLQGLEIIRFCFSWPFKSVQRNLIRLGFELILFTFFITQLIQGLLVQQIMLGNEETLGNYIKLYYQFGWVGFALIFIFNSGYFILFIWDIYVGCQYSNQQMMDKARHQFYFRKVNKSENQLVEGDEQSLKNINLWVKLGNLNNRNYDALPLINMRIQLYKIRRCEQGGFEVLIKRVFQLFMNIQFNFQKQNNIVPGKKLQKKIILTPKLSKQFYQLVEDIWNQHNSPTLQFITIKTFMAIEQSNFKAGEQIPFKISQMSQKIQIEQKQSNIKTFALPKIINGFPINPIILSNL